MKNGHLSYAYQSRKANLNLLPRVGDKFDSWVDELETMLSEIGIDNKAVEEIVDTFDMYLEDLYTALNEYD